MLLRFIYSDVFRWFLTIDFPCCRILLLLSPLLGSFRLRRTRSESGRNDLFSRDAIGAGVCFEAISATALLFTFFNKLKNICWSRVNWINGITKLHKSVRFSNLLFGSLMRFLLSITFFTLDTWFSKWCFILLGGDDECDWLKFRCTFRNTEPHFVLRCNSWDLFNSLKRFQNSPNNRW